MISVMILKSVIHWLSDHNLLFLEFLSQLKRRENYVVIHSVEIQIHLYSTYFNRVSCWHHSAWNLHRPLSWWHTIVFRWMWCPLMCPQSRCSNLELLLLESLKQFRLVSAHSSEEEIETLVCCLPCFGVFPSPPVGPSHLSAAPWDLLQRCLTCLSALSWRSR